MKYDKLIRDNIPDIINKANKKCITDVLNDEEYILKLKQKLLEEGNEVLEADQEHVIEELADVYEVLDAIKKFYDIDENELQAIKNKKAIKNGKFDKRLLLKEVIE